MEAYLDNSATTRPSEAVLAAVNDAMRVHWHNPSALYRPAMEAEKLVGEARRVCLEAVHAQGHRLVFTGSGTEADNLAILGSLRALKKPGRVLVFSAEHPAVSRCIPEIERLGHRAEIIPVTREGLADLAAFEAMLGADVRLICVMQVHNETGAVQPVAEMAALRGRLAPQAGIHVDGVQGFLRVPFDFARLGVQSYAFSGHKIHACKGVGGLIFRRDWRLSPVVFGGGQEDGYRSGTENTPGIIGLGEAVRTFPADGPARMAALRERLWEGIRAAVPSARRVSPPADSPAAAPHILNVTLRPVRSQTMLFALEGDGVYVSAGSACSSHRQKVSPVLTAMGLPADEADCALRFSLCPDLTEAEIDYAAEAVGRHWAALSKYTRR